MRRHIFNHSGFIATAALLLSALLLSPDAAAHGSLGEGAETDLRRMAQEADLVVVAEIVSVDYRNVPIKGEQHSIPNGFVTLKFLQTLRGKPAQAQLTLRFLGGPDGRGGILGVNGVPMFNAGETNLLFIKDNGDKACPLVNCEWGRFRIHKSAVYDTHGSPVLSIAKDHVVSRGLPLDDLTLLRFPTPSFDSVMENPVIKERFSKMGMSYEEAKARYEREAPPFMEYRRVSPKVQEPSVPAEGPVPADIMKQMETPDAGADVVFPKTAPKLDLRKAPAILGGDRPMISKVFIAQVARISAAISRPAGQIQSVDPDALYLLPPIAPTGPAVDKALLTKDDPAPEPETIDPVKPSGGAPQQQQLKLPLPVKTPLQQNQ